jgi:hypothetical protein
MHSRNRVYRDGVFELVQGRVLVVECQQQRGAIAVAGSVGWGFDPNKLRIWIS